MRIIMMLIGSLLIWATATRAQTAQVPYPVPVNYKLGWDHAAPSTVDRFESRIAPGTFADVGKIACPAPNAASFCQPFPTITAPGTYTFEVRACNLAGCSLATPFDFAAVAAPAATPSNIRIIQ